MEHSSKHTLACQNALTKKSMKRKFSSKYVELYAHRFRTSKAVFTMVLLTSLGSVYAQDCTIPANAKELQLFSSDWRKLQRISEFGKFEEIKRSPRKPTYSDKHDDWNRQIRFSSYVNPGDSGSGLYAYSSNYPYVYGVTSAEQCCGTSCTSTYPNYARRITPQFFDFINSVAF